VQAAVAAGVVAEAAGSRLGFRHGLIRQVLYEGMTAGVRAALHLEAARALAAAGAAPERVAAQLVAAIGPAGRAGEREAAGAADTVASTVSAPWLAPWVAPWLADAVPVLAYRAPLVAAELLRGVLAGLPGDDPRRDAVEAGLVTVAFLLARDAEAERAGKLLLARLADPDRAGQVAWLVAYAQVRTGRYAEAEAVIGAALGRPGLSQARAAQLNALRALIAHRAGRVEEAAEAAGVALAGAEQAGNPLAAGYALHVLAGVSYSRRDNAAQLEYTDRALAVTGADPQATDLRLMLMRNRVSCLGTLDRPEEALATAGQALVLAEQAGTPRLNSIRGVLADLYFGYGRWDDALAELEQAAGLLSGPVLPLLVHGIGALIAGHRDDRAVADKHLRAGQDLAVTSAVARFNAVYLLLARALAAEQAGQGAAAAALLGECLEPGIAEELPSLYLMLPTLARLALACGDQALAARAAEAAAAEAATEPLPDKEAAAGFCRGAVGGEAAAVLAAAGYYGRAGRPLEQAQALEEVAVLAAGRGEPAAARQALSSALALYGGLGARWDIRRAGARLRPYGIRAGGTAYRARPASGWAALTPTEARVADLVAEGRSNPDIAAELFLSRNTVQTHVSHILAKLGARSRTEIVRQALTHSLTRQPASMDG
jgi:DNA-binding NarL/FixJ family response regulator